MTELDLQMISRVLAVDEISVSSSVIPQVQKTGSCLQTHWYYDYFTIKWDNKRLRVRIPKEERVINSQTLKTIACSYYTKQETFRAILQKIENFKRLVLKARELRREIF